MQHNYYDEWNALLLKEYFGPANDDEQVWIQTTREELDDFGFRLGGTAGLIDAVKAGPSWCNWSPKQIVTIVNFLIRQRRSAPPKMAAYQDPGEYEELFENLDAPTYMPYVALFVLAASEVGEGGYYATIAELSGGFFESSEETRELLRDVWDDLSGWTNDLSGEYGRFSNLKIGKHAYVGLAKAQALVTQKDRVELPKIFARLGLKPSQPLSPSLMTQVAESVASSDQCSKGMREACNELSVYGDALTEIFSNRLNEWEGSLGERRAKVRGHARTEIPKLQVMLRDTFDGWLICWRSRLDGNFEHIRIKIGDTLHGGEIDPVRGHVIFQSNQPSAQYDAWQLLNESSKSQTSVGATVDYSGDNRLSESIDLELSKVLARGLCWIDTALGAGSALAEAGMPVSGPLYLLTRIADLSEYLEITLASKFELISDTEGLPAAWRLWGIEHVDDLSSGERSALQRLIGDNSGSAERARISFYGGCVIQRAGGRMYLDYDLPNIEVQMPPNSVLECEGLNLTELSPRPDSNIDEKRVSARHYSLARAEGTSKLQFEFSIALGSEKLCTKRLKIASEAGAAVGLHKNFSIGVYGEPRPDSSGARGYMLSAANSIHSTPDFKRYEKPHLLNRWQTEINPTDSLSVRFLDALASKGSLLFGEAKQLIGRLNFASSAKWLSPVPFLYEMQSLGHLEIQTDQRGHLIRVHACEPIIYEVCEKIDSKLVRWRLSGTFRQIVWVNLIKAEEVLVFAHRGVLHIFWEAENARSLHSFAKNNGFSLIANPAANILSWAGSVSGLRSRIGERTIAERSSPSNLERFNPNQARFTSEPLRSMKVDANRQVELFRLDDPIVPAMRVSMLGSLEEDGRANYSYIEDSSWAVWLAFTSFVDFASAHFPDVSPWPICYRAATSSLILPARLRLPSILERALCATSGLLPTKVNYSHTNESGKNSFELFCVESSEKVATLPDVYLDMVAGTWLVYEGVPEELASILVSKLECRLWIEI